MKSYHDHAASYLELAFFRKGILAREKCLGSGVQPRDQGSSSQIAEAGSATLRRARLGREMGDVAVTLS